MQPPDPDLLDQMDQHLLAARHHVLQQRPREAIKEYEAANVMVKQLWGDASAAYAYNLMTVGGLWLSLNQVEASRVNLLAAQGILREAKCGEPLQHTNKRLGIILHWLGQGDLREGHIESALTHLRRAREILVELPLDQGYLILMQDLVNACTQDRRMDEAAAFREEGIALAYALRIRVCCFCSAVAESFNVCKLQLHWYCHGARCRLLHSVNCK